MYYTNIFNDNFVEDVFNELFGGTTDRSCGCETDKRPAPPKRVAQMKTDLIEKEKTYTFEIELPGFDKSEVKIELKDNYLTVSAEHPENKEEKGPDGKFLRRERHYGMRQRSYYVGENVNKEAIKASFNNGVLTIDVPKPEPKEDEKVTIAID